MPIIGTFGAGSSKGYGQGMGGPAFGITALGGDSIVTTATTKAHIFTGDGTFTVSKLGTDPTFGSVVEYFVVAGGGGVGDGHAQGAGGGGGGYRTNGAYNFPVTIQGYPITVGAGGPVRSNTPPSNSSGGNSVFSTITSAGGGGGGNFPYGTANSNGAAGGSGGGAQTFGTGGAGNTPSQSPSQGNGGGNGAGPPGKGHSGGGGGSTSAGTAANSSVGGDAGAGTASDITGSQVYYSLGGYGGATERPAGSAAPGRTTDVGVANSGQGGQNIQAGGSGVVVLRYRIA